MESKLSCTKEPVGYDRTHQLTNGNSNRRRGMWGAKAFDRKWRLFLSRLNQTHLPWSWPCWREKQSGCAGEQSEGKIVCSWRWRKLALCLRALPYVSVGAILCGDNTYILRIIRIALVKTTVSRSVNTTGGRVGEWCRMAIVYPTSHLKYVASS